MGSHGLSEANSKLCQASFPRFEAIENLIPAGEYMDKSDGDASLQIVRPIAVMKNRSRIDPKCLTTSPISTGWIPSPRPTYKQYNGYRKPLSISTLFFLLNASIHLVVQDFFGQLVPVGD